MALEVIEEELFLLSQPRAPLPLSLGTLENEAEAWVSWSKDGIYLWPQVETWPFDRLQRLILLTIVSPITISPAEPVSPLAKTSPSLPPPGNLTHLKTC